MEIQNIDQGNDFILEINRQNKKNENKRCKKLHLFACFFTLSKVRTDTERHHGATRHKYTLISATFKPLQMLNAAVKILQILEFTFYYFEEGL